MGRKGRSRRGRRRRRRAASQFVAESMLTGEKTFATGSQFDAGYVKRKKVEKKVEMSCDKKKYSSVTATRRREPPVEETEPEPDPGSDFRSAFSSFWDRMISFLRN